MIERIYLWTGIFFFILGILSLLRDFRAQQVALESIRVDQLHKQIEKIDIKNILLKEKILFYESYTEISSEAASLGFHEPTGSELIILK